MADPESSSPAPNDSRESAGRDRRRVGPRRSEASTQAVLEAAYGELSEHGWRGFSVDRVARTAHASKQTIYRWWKSPACLAVDAALAKLGPPKPPGGPGGGPGGGDVRERISALVEPLLVAIRTGNGAHAWRGALLAAADDQDAGEAFRAWFGEQLRTPLRHLLAELALKGQLRRDWDIDLATELLFGPVWHRLVAMRGPVPEAYSRRLVDSVLKALQPG